ncbi:hypothetical protein AGLY_001252 [Aphis glycines]|uniref:Uncharacterized protein n=1 Tax=Aphis glycines TaxID=307491 RepID=A0A6G0UAQ9_APHGL|nr:hypothetical protein AGLY_001252 [Aphis glycines]
MVALAEPVSGDDGDDDADRRPNGCCCGGGGRVPSPSESAGLLQSRPLPQTGDDKGELHKSAAAAARAVLAPRCLPRPYSVDCRADDWACAVDDVTVVPSFFEALTLLLLLLLLAVLLLLLLLLFVLRLDFHFSVAAAANAVGRPSPPNRGPDADLHVIRNSDRPVLHIGSPSRSNMSCNRGLFTRLSTSQSLPNAGLRSQGFRSESTNMSKPYNSKQFVVLGMPVHWLANVRLTRTDIFCHNSQSLTPAWRTESDFFFCFQIVGSQLVNRTIGQVRIVVIEVIQRILVGTESS